MAYRNPLPVAVALQPVYDTRGTALVVITRTIAPARGGIALPGGFIDHREDWRHAVVRELKEETGIDAASRDVRLADAMSSPDGHLLLFGLLPERPAAELPPSAATDETEGWHLLRRPAELAFPLHTLAAQRLVRGPVRLRRARRRSELGRLSPSQRSEPPHPHRVRGLARPSSPSRSTTTRCPLPRVT